MRNSKLGHRLASEQAAKIRANSVFRISYFAFFFLVGCGAPGNPHPPEPVVPAAIVDLKLQQAGDAVELIFTLPRSASNGERIAESPAIEIFRGAAGANGSADEKSFRQVFTVPGALVSSYMQDDRVHFLDPVAPEEVRAHPGETLVYRVRTRASQKRASADSNAVSVSVYPVPEPIAQVQTRVTETAIELTWPAPSRTSGGDTALFSSSYHVYRGELDPQSAAALPKDAPINLHKDLPRGNWKSPLALLAPSATNGFRDIQFEFGSTYIYVVRSVVTAGGGEIESGDSAPTLITALDTFPPSAPQGLVAVSIAPGTPPAPQVELSWSLNSEPDVAGYRVYRSEQEGTPGQLLTPELLPTPAFRDMTVLVGRRYWFTVRAVDRAGNESDPAPPAIVEITQPSP